MKKFTEEPLAKITPTFLSPAYTEGRMNSGCGICVARDSSIHSVTDDVTKQRKGTFIVEDMRYENFGNIRKFYCRSLLYADHEPTPFRMIGGILVDDKMRSVISALGKEEVSAVEYFLAACHIRKSFSFLSSDIESSARILEEAKLTEERKQTLVTEFSTLYHSVPREYSEKFEQGTAEIYSAKNIRDREIIGGGDPYEGLYSSGVFINVERIGTFDLASAHNFWIWCFSKSEKAELPDDCGRVAYSVDTARLFDCLCDSTSSRNRFISVDDRKVTENPKQQILAGCVKYHEKLSGLKSCFDKHEYFRGQEEFRVVFEYMDLSRPVFISDSPTRFPAYANCVTVSQDGRLCLDIPSGVFSKV